MISAEEALKSDRVKLTDDELRIFGIAEAVIDAAIRDNFSGQPLDFSAAIEELPARVAWALKRRYEKPAFDSSRWIVSLMALSQQDKVVGHRFVFEPAPPADYVGVKKTDAFTVGKPQGIVKQLFEELASLHGWSPEMSSQLALKPTLSVLFGTYNRIELLKGVVSSVRKSVGKHSYEIVVCDGGSTDGSRQWLAAQRDIILIGEQHLEGAVKAFNQCYAMCRGEFIANLNDDCIVEGDALSRGVDYLREHSDVGQVAFAFNKIEGDVGVNDVYPRKQHPHVTWPTAYANFGVVRREAATQVVAIQGGFWNPIYRTYGADVEFSAWLHKLGWKIAPLLDAKISDTRIVDELRAKNTGASGVEAKRMGMRWPAEAFRPDGPDPKVSLAELERFRVVRGDGGLGKALQTVAAVPVVPESSVPDDALAIAELVGWPEPQEEERLRALAPLVHALDPIEGKLPKRAEKLGAERVLHVALVTKADPQAGLVRALKEWGSAGYAQVNWLEYAHEQRQQKIIDASAALKPTVVFMQLQAPNAVDVETVKKIREVSPEAVIVTWCGDIASDNSPWGADGKSNLDWQAPLGRVVDLTLHSSMAHVHVLRAAGIHTAGYLQIGYDEEQYQPLDVVTDFEYDVAFLGSRYGGSDAFSKSMKTHDGPLRDEVVRALHEKLGERFGLFGSGWDFNDGKKVALEYAHEIYWKSKMGLNVSLVNDYACYTSDRLHRILGCGALLLTKDFPLMSTYGLEHGVNCLVWTTLESAVHYACNATDAAVERIRWAGAKLARENLTWSVRMKELQCYLDAVRSAR